MENASKALLMAGGILIALLILSALVIFFTNLAEYQTNQDNSKLATQIAEFNDQYEPYNKENLTLMELKSVYNKILDNNQKATEAGVAEDKINTNIPTIYPAITGNWSDIVQDEKKTRRFVCTGIKYRSDGRICEINFVKTK